MKTTIDIVAHAEYTDISVRFSIIDGVRQAPKIYKKVGDESMEVDKKSLELFELLEALDLVCYCDSLLK